MDEQKIINLLKNKNQTGLLALIENYSGILYSVISKTLINHPYLHEEVLNDTLLAIWDNIESYDANRSSFKNWSASVARYKAIDALRKEIKHSYIQLHPECSNHAEQEYNNVLIKEIFSYLSDEDRELFVSLFLDGYSYEELSHNLGVTKNSLYSRVKRGRQKLKKEFKG